MAVADPPELKTEQSTRASHSPMAVDSAAEATAGSRAAATGESNEDQESSDQQRLTIASCKACNTDFATFYNGFIRITGSYYLPSRQGSYRITALHAKGKAKPAAEQSALNGCTIQQLVCNCDDTLAIVCIKAPDSKRAYAERDFFKLPKIQLRSNTDGKLVDPIIEGDHQVVSPKPQPIEAPTMERPAEAAVATVQKPLLPSMSVLGHKPQEDLRRNDMPAARTIPSQELRPKPIVSERDVTMMPPTRLPERGAAPPVSNGQVQMNGSVADAGYPSHLAVKLDAVDRLQTQVNLNRATLESCTRDITRLEVSFRQLHAEFKDTVEAVRMDLMASRQQAAATATNVTTPTGDRLDDHALEIFSSKLSQVVAKTNDVDALQIQFEIIKRRLKRLEEGGVSPSVAVHPHHLDRPIHHAPMVPHPPPQVVRPPPPPEPRMLPSQPAPRAAYPPEATHIAPQPANAPAAASWTSVNSGVKRGPPAGPDGVAENSGTPVGSPKRAKLAPLEPRYAYEAQAGSTPIRYERMDTDESNATHDHRMGSHDSHADVSTPSNFVSYHQDGSAEDGWRPVSQRAVSGPAGTGSSPRGRGRGRGRGGRPRKTMPLEPHIQATPEWDRDGHAGPLEREAFYHGIARAPSGPGPSPIPAPGPIAGPAIGLSPTQAFDPYGHTKRSRTKPIRNADGILIRKDGRPDMRSQSSAANLRKVHAKKEEERRDSNSAGPTSGLAGDPLTAGHSPASTDSHDVEMGSPQDRSDHIMKQMFPKGVEQDKARMQQYFSAEQSPADSASATPADREFTDSVEPDTAGGDTPQQRMNTMEDGVAEDKAFAKPKATNDQPNEEEKHDSEAAAASEPATDASTAQPEQS